MDKILPRPSGGGIADPFCGFGREARPGQRAIHGRNLDPGIRLAANGGTSRIGRAERAGLFRQESCKTAGGGQRSCQLHQSGKFASG